ncbi:hypothetical protein [Colwellia piezophila]|uniref:hypothetical protein n=1 Tax=Colwellia piezophila TaxID=211668 RepID=UPI0012FA59F3|nr:hypothetical protein [Colwellia piezophila]
MLNLNSKVKKYTAAFFPLLILSVLFYFTLNNEQTKKEMIYKSFSTEQARNQLNKGYYYRYLKNIECSLPNISNEDVETLDLYLEMFKTDIELLLKSDSISSKTRESLTQGLNHKADEC